MRKILLLGLASLLLVHAGATFAQGEPGDVGVFFDPAGTTSTACWPAFTTTNQFWVAGFDLEEGVRGYELGLIIDPTIIIFASVMDQPGGTINIGAAPHNWIVWTGACLDGSGVFSLLRFTAGYFVPSVADLLVCTTSSTPSSFVPATPGYLTCADQLVPFGVAQNGSGIYPDGCGVICPSAEAPIPADSFSWGSVKASY